MKLLVLDGNSIVNRAYYGIRLLTTKDGTYTNAIHGFFTMLLKMQEEEQPDAVAIAFDLKAPTFRHKLYDGYKANRHGMPEELAQQMPLLKELLEDLGYPLVSKEGYEADDILGTLAAVCNQTEHTCTLATGDRDSLQLVSPHTTVRLLSTKNGQPQVTYYDMAKVEETYGLRPEQLIDLKALMGDTSDNIPGVKGVGEKTALPLIQQCGSVEQLYQKLDALSITANLKKKLLEGKDSAMLSYTLGKIDCNAPIDTDISHYRMGAGNPQKAANLLAKLELFQLLERLQLSPNSERKEETAVPASPLSASVWQEEAVLTALKKETALYTVAQYEKDAIQTLFLHLGDTIAVVEKPSKKFLSALFVASSLPVTTDDSKALYRALDALSLVPNIVKLDTGLAGYVLNPSSSEYDVSRLSALYQITPPPLETEETLASTLPFLTTLASLPALAKSLTQALEENGQLSLLQTIELPLAYVLARMERIGLLVDKGQIEAYGHQLQNQISALETEIFALAGHPFNINSPKQLGVVLFEELGLPPLKKTKTGYSTSADVLEKLRPDYPIIGKILSYRGLAKLKSTYCDGLQKATKADGRIHSTFLQTETRTGRISSTEPNLQNIPIRTEEGREIRKFFLAKENCCLVDADYSQIELRVLASIAHDTAMTTAFLQGEDIHRATAAQVFHLPEAMVTPLMRSRAKAVNFGIVYGISAFSLSDDIGVSVKEAKEYIENYLSHFHGVANYMQLAVETATKTGYAETLFGRRRYLPELKSKNFQQRSFGQRVALNMPIQGTAADIIKLAMIRVEQRLQRENLQARLVLQVHDELLVEAPLTEQEQVKTILQEEMEGAVSLAVPMVAEATCGKTWYDAKG